MTRHYEAYLKLGDRMLGGPVGMASKSEDGEIALRLAVVPVGEQYHISLKPIPSEE